MRLKPAQIPVRIEREADVFAFDRETNPRSIGCSTCPQLGLCGGLHVPPGTYDCLSLCCGRPDRCDRVCRMNASYVARVREVGSFELQHIPRQPVLVTSELPRYIPMLMHGSRRARRFPGSCVGVPFFHLVNLRNGEARFQTREALCAQMQLHPGAQLIVSGTAKDPPIEAWWSLGPTKRRAILSAIQKLDVSLATTPNYSFITDQPRWNDLHAMKRIALINAEFIEAGIPSALHANGRTDRDFERWTDFIARRPEVTHLAYEFATGAHAGERRSFHLKWLKGLAKNVGRPLNLLIRGGGSSFETLKRSFGRVTFLDTVPFMKTMKRQMAVAGPPLAWIAAHTDHGLPLDDLLKHNVSILQAHWEQATDTRLRKSGEASRLL